MALGEVRLAGVAQGLRGADRRGCGGRGDAAMLVWFAVALVFRRRFQFSLRSLLVMVVVVALPYSWLAVEMRQARLQKEAVDMVVSLGGSVFHDERRTFDANSGMLPNATTPEWLWNLLGEDFFAAAFQIFPFTMSYQAWEPVEDEARLKALWLSYTTVTDAKLEYLKVFPQLQNSISKAPRFRTRDCNMSRH